MMITATTTTTATTTIATTEWREKERERERNKNKNKSHRALAEYQNEIPQQVCKVMIVRVCRLMWFWMSFFYYSAKKNHVQSFNIKRESLACVCMSVCLWTLAQSKRMSKKITYCLNATIKCQNKHYENCILIWILIV